MLLSGSGLLELYDPQTGREIDLFRLLKSSGNIDRKVLIGKDHPIEVRIIAAEVSQETAGHRRQKAKTKTMAIIPAKRFCF